MHNNISDSLVRILACPRCKGDLETKDEALVCNACNLWFPITNNIPNMLLNVASKGKFSDTYLAHVQTSTETKDFYDKFYSERTDYIRFNKSDLAFVAQVFKLINKNPNKAMVLDVGAGTGYFIALIEQLVGKGRVVGVDFSMEGFSTAQQVYGINQLAIMDAYDMGFQPNSFDVIFAIGLTPYKKSNIEDVAELTRKITMPLKKGGHFVFVFSSNLSGKITTENVDTTKGGAGKATYYNHNAKFIRKAFKGSGQFSRISDYAFIRPLAVLQGSSLFSRFNTKITELLMKITLRKFSARLVVIGEKI